MAVMTWDEAGKKYYHTGVSDVALFPMANGAYKTGVNWDGVTAINEAPEGGDATELYADNILYGIIRSAEKFKGSILTYCVPNEFVRQGSVDQQLARYNLRVEDVVKDLKKAN